MGINQYITMGVQRIPIEMTNVDTVVLDTVQLL